MHQRAFALVAMLLMTGVAAAQQPQLVWLQQRAKQSIQPSDDAEAPDDAASFGSQAYYAHQQALAATASQVAQRVAFELPVPEPAAPRPALLAPSLAPSPSSPGLIKAPGAKAKSPKKPPIRLVRDPNSPSQRPAPPAPPLILPSAHETYVAQGKAPAGKGGASAPGGPLEETKPATTPDDPFGDPAGGAPPVVVPPDEPASDTPAANPLDPHPGPVIVPPSETPAAEEPLTPDEMNEAPPPRTAPRTAPPRARPPETRPERTPRPPARSETLPPPRGGMAPRELTGPEQLPSPTQENAPQPTPDARMMDDSHDFGLDEFGFDGAGGEFYPRRPRKPFFGLGGGTFNGYYDRYCPPEGPPINFEDCRPACGTWATFDALAWWSRGASLPALVTTGSQAFGGALNNPLVVVTFGNQRVDSEIRAGGRLNVGTWVNDDRTIGFGGAFFDLQQSVTNFAAGSNGDPLIARPFFDTTTNTDNAETVARNNIASGNVSARTTNNALGADLYMRMSLYRRRGRLLDFVHGYRYLQINDSIQINDSSVSTDPDGPIPLGTSITGIDQFRASNQFQGWQFGLLGEQQIGRFTFGGSGKLGVGNMRQVVDIFGSNTVTVPGVAPVVRAGSLLAQPSNMGRYAQDTFGFIPEFNFNLGYQVTSRLRLNVGYSFLWVNHVAQSGRQINTSIDSNQLFGLPGNAPTFHFQENSYWLQGMNLGIDYRF